MSCTEALKNQRRTQLTLLLGILVSAIFVLQFNYRFQAESYENICMSEECVLTSANFLQKINVHANPCVDFNKFMWNPPSSRTLTNESTFSKWRNLLEEPSQNNDSKALKMLKLFYTSCTDKTKGAQNLIFFKQAFSTLGGWPVIDPDWNVKKFDWKHLLYRLRRSGWRYNFFLQIYIGPNFYNNTNNNVLSISPMELGFLQNIFANATKTEAYIEFLKQTVVLFGAGELSAGVEMKEVLQFERELLKISLPSTGYNTITIKELQSHVPGIPWLQLINNYLSPLIMLSSKDIVNVASVKFLASLSDLLMTTSKRVLANYMFLKIVKDSIIYLPEQFNDQQSTFFAVIDDNNKIEPMWKLCVRDINKLPLATTLVYSNIFVKNRTEDKLLELAENIKITFLNNMENNPWLDHDSKKNIYEKIEQIKFLTTSLQDKQFEEYYEGLELNSGSYLTLFFYLSSFMHLKEVQKLKYSGNDFYTVSSNSSSLVLHAGILQDTIFLTEGPQYINYGTAGTVIAHKIVSHVFETKIMKQDPCDSFANLALRLAYDSYVRRIKSEEVQLPGLQFSSRQMFWISAATVWRYPKLPNNFSIDFNCSSRVYPMNKCQLW